MKQPRIIILDEFDGNIAVRDPSEEVMDILLKHLPIKVTPMEDHEKIVEGKIALVNALVKKNNDWEDRFEDIKQMIEKLRNEFNEPTLYPRTIVVDKINKLLNKLEDKT